MNPLVNRIKLSYGVIDPLVLQSNGNLELQVLYIVTKTHLHRAKSNLVDQTPVIIPIRVISVRENKLEAIRPTVKPEKDIKELFPVKSIAQIPGLFGLDLNLMFSTDKTVNHLLSEERKSLLTSLKKFTTSNPIEQSELRKLAISRIRELLNIFPQIFITIPEKYILMQLQFFKNSVDITQPNKTTDYLTLYQQIIPKMTIS